MSLRRTSALPSKPLHIRGIPAAPGMAMGPVYLLEKSRISIVQYWISDKEVSGEIQRFKIAIEKTKAELSKIRDRLCRYEGGTQIGILESYQMILQDELLIENTLKSIQRERINAEWALEKTFEQLKKVFINFDEEYFRERTSDILYVSERILKNLAGKPEDPTFKIPPHSIIIAHDLSPADTAQLTKFHIGGFITEVGGSTSHTAIIARALHIPALVGCSKITRRVRRGEKIILQGDQGLAILRPDSETIRKFNIAYRQGVNLEKNLLKDAHLPAETRDGFRIRLLANMELLEEMDSIKLYGAEGIGLYRTEFLYLNRKDFPNEEEHFCHYQQILKSMHPKTAIFRTLDMGGDKLPTTHPYPREENPALGLRAIRLCFREKEIFKTQLKALLRASPLGKMKILLPMITSLNEVLQVKKLIADLKRELEEQKLAYDPDIKLGVMIEAPAAVLIAEELAQEIDFFSIGTNDLIQYSLAVDRANENVAHLYRPFHPAILRMIRHVTEVGKKHEIPVEVCGEVASEPLFILILLGLGLSELSMNAVSIPRVKRIIRSLYFKDAQALVQKVLGMKNENEIEAYVKKEMRRLIPSQKP